MTIYSTKVVKLLVEPIDYQCAYCHTVHTMDMYIFQKYASVLGVPFFPTDKTGVAICTHCLKILKRKQMSPELLSVYSRIKTHATMPVWTWAGAGALILLSIIIFSIVLK